MLTVNDGIDVWLMHISCLRRTISQSCCFIRNDLIIRIFGSKIALVSDANVKILAQIIGNCLRVSIHINIEPI